MRVSTSPSDDPEDLCRQCYGRGWITVKRRRVSCTCRLRKAVPSPDPEER